MTTNHHTAIATGAAANAATINSPLGELDAAITAVGARVYNSADLTIPNNTLTTLTFDSETFDTDALHSTSTNTDRVTVPVAGYYLLIATVRWEANATGERRLLIRENAANYIAASNQSPGGSVNAEQNAMCVYYLAENEYVQLRAFQSSGGNLDVLASTEYTPHFTAFLLKRG